MEKVRDPNVKGLPNIGTHVSWVTAASVMFGLDELKRPACVLEGDIVKPLDGQGVTWATPTFLQTA